jgi:Glycogen debranching enzyme
MSDHQPVDLRCEYLNNPLGIDVERPRLSWRLHPADPNRRGLRQTAYQILAATREDLLSEGTADLWNSGKVETDQSVHVPYGGETLGSGRRAFWTVRTWDENGAASDFAAPAFWENGLLSQDDWQGARWIGGGLVGGPRTMVPAPYLRKVFTLDAPPENARLYVTALGVYDVFLNGERVGADQLTPGWTNYRTHVRHQTYDVTALLRPGENVLAARLGDGWYCGFVGPRDRQVYGDRPRLLACLKASGETPALVTDATWKVAYGPILESDMLMGEAYDARREMPGWDAPGFDEDNAAWVPATLFDHPEGLEIVGQDGPTIRVTEEVAPVEEPRRYGNAWIFDLGQNLVGRARLKVKGPAGATVRLRFAEVLQNGPAATDGPIYTDNLRAAKQTDVYTLKGDPNGEVWEPAFTFHGFRYVEAVGLPEPPTRETLTAVVMHSDCPRTGDFSCSDPLINRLQKNIDWGWRGNSVDVPTDCPQRDERLGWTGDAQVFIRTSTFNRNVAPFFAKWLRDLADAQGPEGGYPSVAPDVLGGRVDGGPAWADAGIICPWTLYLAYGDTTVLERQYDSMCRFLGYLEETQKEGIRCWEGSNYHCYGDWLALDGSGRTTGGTPKDLIGTAFFAHDANLLSRIATILGRDEDATRYRKRFEEVRAAFQKRFVTEDGLVFPGTQTAYVLALHFDLLPEALRPAAAENLVREVERRGNKLSTGFVGSPYLPHVLSESGRADVAFRLLHQKDWPSYLYAVTQGATTIWERWDGWTHDKGFQSVGMNSFNHYAYGAIGEWLYQRVAGIDTDEATPGYKRLVLKPTPAGSGLTHVSAYLDTAYGRVESAWRVENEAELVWDVTVPPNTTAVAHVPGADGDAGVHELEPGRYTFRSRLE